MGSDSENPTDAGDAEETAQACGCAAPASAVATTRGPDEQAARQWIVGSVDTPGGPVSRVAARLSFADRLGAVRVRLNIRRMQYAVSPGLYAVGAPTGESPVLVSANYKLSFDRLRQELIGLNAWILVLDTKGINVWCAAGKGTFGTEEIVGRIASAALADVVSHRTLIVPQLGAPGVSAHEVKQRSGFRVVYGPIRARDLPAFLDAGMRATPEMRRVRFNLADRLVVVPVELVQWGKYALLVMAGLILLAGVHRGGYDPALALSHGLRAAALVLLAFLAGGIAAPVLLPWLPGRAFSVKGAILGLVSAAAGMLWSSTGSLGGWLEMLAWFLILPAVSGFVAMNYTGTSTYTSLSGVRREMRVAVPLQVAAGAAGLVLWLAARFFMDSDAAVL